jgi:hypothetical protein
MNTGSINFSAKTSGLVIEEVSTESDHPRVSSITCSIGESGVIKIAAKLIDVYAEDWPDLTIIEEIQRFINVLSFEFESPIRSLRASGYSLKKNDGSESYQVSSELVALFDIAEATLKPGNQSLIRFKQRFKDLCQLSSIRLYASAMQQEDPIARFMFLYNIILTLSRDKQAVVDGKILAVAPDTPRTTSPIKRAAEETVYTRLRNEIAHNRVGAEFPTTSKEIRSWVKKLEKITKELILENG